MKVSTPKLLPKTFKAYYESYAQELSFSDIFVAHYAVFTLISLICTVSHKGLSLLFILSLGLLGCLIPLYGKKCIHILSSLKKHQTDALLLLFFFILTGTCYLFIHRPDPDDHSYLKIALLPLASTEMPLIDLKDPYKITSFSFFNSCLKLLSTQPLLLVYYSITPLFFCGLTLLNYRRLFKYALPSVHWALLMAIYLVIMFTWADVHRSYANFGFVRMFQGKGVLVTLMIPTLLYHFMHYADGKKNRFQLITTIIATAGLTPTASIIIPVFSSLFILAIWMNKSSDYDWQRAFYDGVTLNAYPCLIGLLSMYYQMGSIGNEQFMPLADSIDYQTKTEFISTLSLYFRATAGEGGRAILSILSLLLLGFITRHKSLRNFSLILLAMLIFPYTSRTFTSVYSSSSWRWFWIIPMPFALTLMMAAPLSFVKRKTLGIMLTLSLVSFFALTNAYYTFRFDFYAPYSGKVFFSPIKLPFNPIHEFLKMDPSDIQRDGNQLIYKGKSY